MVLADFETSKLMAASGPSPSTVTSVLHVSFGYTAPELLGLGGHSKYSEKSDMYAVGVVLAQLLIGRWGGDVAPPTAKTVAACGDDVVSPKVKKLLLQLLSENPDRRPSAQALLLLSFFRSPCFAEIALPFIVAYFFIPSAMFLFQGKTTSGMRDLSGEEAAFNGAGVRRKALYV